MFARLCKVFANAGKVFEVFARCCNGLGSCSSQTITKPCKKKPFPAFAETFQNQAKTLKTPKTFPAQKTFAEVLGNVFGVCVLLVFVVGCCLLFFCLLLIFVLNYFVWFVCFFCFVFVRLTFFAFICCCSCLFLFWLMFIFWFFIWFI